MSSASKTFPPGEAPAAEARAEAALARELAPNSAPLDIALDEARAKPGGWPAARKRSATSGATRRSGLASTG